MGLREVIRTMNLCLCVWLLFGLADCKYGYIMWSNNSAIAYLSEHATGIPDAHVARAIYNNEINQTGWAFLELHTANAWSDEQQAYSAGYLEGYLTRDLIWFHWQNMLKGYCFNKTDVCKKIEKYLDVNENYIFDMVSKHYGDPYWYQVKLYYSQLEGLTSGYNEATTCDDEHLTLRDIVWMNMLGDLDELAMALSMAPSAKRMVDLPSHCTGLVKLLPDLSNLYTSQVTWNSYQSMLRLQKMYVLHYRMARGSRKRIPGYKMSMSSYPGFVQSTDDFYIVSSGLVPAETTIGNTNRDLLKYVHPRGQILEYIRVMVANRLATDGRSWVELFRRHNSGTYNNQWYIVDYNKFRPRTAGRAGRVLPGLLWVVEQLPGNTEAADLTSELVRTTYFPSYNIAYFPRIFNLSGGKWRVATFGDWFAYYTNPRGRMIAEQQAGIVNLRAMFRVLRYNDYRHDPLARCAACRPPYSACNAIAARNDLNPANGTYPFRALGHRSHGATDAKVTSAALRTNYQFVAVSSPPHNLSRGIPPFTWSEFDLGPTLSHLGHPDTWTFAPLLHRWEWG